MKQKRQLKTGGLSMVEALLLAVAVAVVGAVLYRVTASRKDDGKPGTDPVEIASARVENGVSTSGSARDQGAASTTPAGAARSATRGADPRDDGRSFPPLPPGVEDEDFSVPSARRAGDGLRGVGEDDAFLDADLTLEDGELLDEEVVTALDLFRDMVGDDTAALADKKELIEVMGMEDIYEALDLVGEMEWGPEAESLFGSLMARWGKLDPASAMEYAADLESRRVKQSAMNLVLKSWARDDPQAAFAWFSGLSEVDIRSLGSGARTLFKGMAAADPMWALDQAWSLPTRSLKVQALQTALGALTQQGYEPDALVALYQGMPMGPDRALMAQTIVDQWTRYQPEAAARWIETLTDDGSYKRVVDRLVVQWSQDDPSSASRWVADLPDPNLRRVQMGRVVQAWVRTDPGAASDWLSSYPPSVDLDPAIHSLARGVMKDDPVSAWDWAAAVTAGGARNRLMQQVGREWMRQDPANAAAGIASSSLPPNIKNKLLN